MSIAQPPTGSGAAGSRKVRRLFWQALSRCQGAATAIKTISDEEGKSALETALGDDGAELDTAYAALKTLILALDPEAEVADL